MEQATQPALDRAFERIEETILPSLSLLLDGLLEAAVNGRPGVDADVHAAEIRSIAGHLQQVTRQVESLSNCAYLYAAPPRERMSA